MTSFFLIVEAAFSAFHYLILFTLQFITQDKGHHNTHKANDKTTKQRLPKVIDCESNAEGLGNGTGEHKHGSIDEKSEQAQCKQDQRAGEEFEQRA